MRRHSRSPGATSGGAPQRSAALANSSAFSESANPDEDWTQIADLAERRRIQNRIAQRNYRKKLKRNKEQLKASGSASPSIDDDGHSTEEDQSETSGFDDSVYAMASPEMHHLSPSMPVTTSSQYLMPSRGASAPAYLDHSVPPQVAATYAYSFSSDPNLLYTQSYSQSAPQYDSGSYTTNRAFQTPYMPGPSASDMSTAVMQPLTPSEELLNPLSLNYAMITGIDLPTSKPAEDSKSSTHRPMKGRGRNSRSIRSMDFENEYLPPSYGLTFGEAWIGEQPMVFEC